MICIVQDDDFEDSDDEDGAPLRNAKELAGMKVNSAFAAMLLLLS